MKYQKTIVFFDEKLENLCNMVEKVDMKNQELGEDSTGDEDLFFLSFIFFTLVFRHN